MADVGKKLLDIVISVFFMAVMLPIALVAIADDSNWMYNTTHTLWAVMENGSTFQTLVQVLIPLLLIIGILGYFMPKYGIKARM